MLILFLPAFLALFIPPTYATVYPNGPTNSSFFLQTLNITVSPMGVALDQLKQGSDQLVFAASVNGNVSELRLYQSSGIYCSQWTYVRNLTATDSFKPYTQLELLPLPTAVGLAFKRENSLYWYLYDDQNFTMSLDTILYNTTVSSSYSLGYINDLVYLAIADSVGQKAEIVTCTSILCTVLSKVTLSSTSLLYGDVGLVYDPIPQDIWVYVGEQNKNMYIFKCPGLNCSTGPCTNFISMSDEIGSSLRAMKRESGVNFASLLMTGGPQGTGALYCSDFNCTMGIDRVMLLSENVPTSYGFRLFNYNNKTVYTFSNSASNSIDQYFCNNLNCSDFTPTTAAFTGVADLVGNAICGDFPMLSTIQTTVTSQFSYIQYSTPNICPFTLFPSNGTSSIFPINCCTSCSPTTQASVPFPSSSAQCLCIPDYYGSYPNCSRCIDFATCAGGINPPVCISGYVMESGLCTKQTETSFVTTTSTDTFGFSFGIIFTIIIVICLICVATLTGFSGWQVSRFVTPPPTFYEFLMTQKQPISLFSILSDIQEPIVFLFFQQIDLSSILSTFIATCSWMIGVPQWDIGLPSYADSSAQLIHVGHNRQLLSVDTMSQQLELSKSYVLVTIIIFFFFLQFLLGIMFLLVRAVLFSKEAAVATYQKRKTLRLETMRAQQLAESLKDTTPVEDSLKDTTPVEDSLKDTTPVEDSLKNTADIELDSINHSEAASLPPQEKVVENSQPDSDDIPKVQPASPPAPAPAPAPNQSQSQSQNQTGSTNEMLNMDDFRSESALTNRYWTTVYQISNLAFFPIVSSTTLHLSLWFSGEKGFDDAVPVIFCLIGCLFVCGYPIVQVALYGKRHSSKVHQNLTDHCKEYRRDFPLFILFRKFLCGIILGFVTSAIAQKSTLIAIYIIAIAIVLMLKPYFAKSRTFCDVTTLFVTSCIVSISFGLSDNQETVATIIIIFYMVYVIGYAVLFVHLVRKAYRKFYIKHAEECMQEKEIMSNVSEEEIPPKEPCLSDIQQNEQEHTKTDIEQSVSF